MISNPYIISSLYKYKISNPYIIPLSHDKQSVYLVVPTYGELLLYLVFRIQIKSSPYILLCNVCAFINAYFTATAL